MSQKPTRLPPSEHPIQSNHKNMKPKMGGEFTYQPKWDPKTVLTHSHIVGHLNNPGGPKTRMFRLPKQSQAGAGFTREPRDSFALHLGAGKPRDGLKRGKNLGLRAGVSSWEL